MPLCRYDLVLILLPLFASFLACKIFIVVLLSPHILLETSMQGKVYPP